MKIFRILVLLLIISLYNTASGQDLPEIENVHEENLDERKELLRITYNDSCYYLEDMRVQTIKSIKDSICTLIKRKNVNYIDIPTGYVSFYLNKNTEILVLDSIRNELQGLNLFTVFYKLKGKENNGYFLRLNSSSDLKIDFFKNKGLYYPNITEWSDCLIENDNEGEYTEESIPITRQTKPKDIFLRIKNGKLKNLENNKDLYVFSLSQKSLIIDGVKIKSKNIANSINNILEKGNYIFVIDMSLNNTYEDYIECLYYIFSEVENKREKYIDLIESGKKEDYSKYFARRKYPIVLLSIFPSDRQFINNNR
ncbi:MAG: hypothetical protein IMY72_13305 [Bacteroidetes bacterium]|nr:hypothetical protein [Bacteroidota bacterium]